MSPRGQRSPRTGRSWGDGPTAVFVGCNPSKADEKRPDMTITKSIEFAKRAHCGSVIWVNFFGLIATDPLLLTIVLDPWGTFNERALVAALTLRTPHHVIAAWGTMPNKTILERSQTSRALVQRHAAGSLKCLGVTKAGDPRHPSRLGYSARMQEWRF